MRWIARQLLQLGSALSPACRWSAGTNSLGLPWTWGGENNWKQAVKAAMVGFDHKRLGSFYYEELVKKHWPVFFRFTMIWDLFTMKNWWKNIDLFFFRFTMMVYCECKRLGVGNLLEHIAKHHIHESTPHRPRQPFKSMMPWFHQSKTWHSTVVQHNSTEWH